MALCRNGPLSKRVCHDRRPCKKLLARERRVLEKFILNKSVLEKSINILINSTQQIMEWKIIIFNKWESEKIDKNRSFSRCKFLMKNPRVISENHPKSHDSNKNKSLKLTLIDLYFFNFI
jgi:hypothetical protein